MCVYIYIYYFVSKYLYDMFPIFVSYTILKIFLLHKSERENSKAREQLPGRSKKYSYSFLPAAARPSSTSCLILMMIKDDEHEEDRKDDEDDEDEHDEDEHEDEDDFEDDKGTG